MTDLDKPTVTICSNPEGQNDCCDLRITGLRSVDDLVYFREEIGKTGFSVKRAENEGGDCVVWTLERPYGELISELHLHQLSIAIKHVGMAEAS